MGFLLYIGIDRKLDYNLPIYLELQAQDKTDLGGEVRRVRFFVVVLKGGRSATVGDQQDTVGWYLGDRDEHERTSLSILPHTELEKIDLPARAGLDPDNYALDLRIENKTLIKGHKFRPYRIRSSSFLMGVQEIESNW